MASGTEPYPDQASLQNTGDGNGFNITIVPRAFGGMSALYYTCRLTPLRSPRFAKQIVRAGALRQCRVILAWTRFSWEKNTTSLWSRRSSLQHSPIFSATIPMWNKVMYSCLKNPWMPGNWPCFISFAIKQHNAAFRFIWLVVLSETFFWTAI